MSEFSDEFSPETRADKARLRAGLLADRRARPSDQEDALVRAALVELATGVPVVAGYAPLPGEPGGTGLPDALMSACGELLLPVLAANNDLDWARYRGRLVPAGRRLREPPGEPLGRYAIASADLVIVPATAVDRRGVRLGRGGGSYDRALSRVPPGTLVVAVVYDAELLDEVPEQPHDRRVGGVLTPHAGLLRF